MAAFQRQFQAVRRSFRRKRRDYDVVFECTPVVKRQKIGNFRPDISEEVIFWHFLIYFRSISCLCLKSDKCMLLFEVQVVIECAFTVTQMQMTVALAVLDLPEGHVLWVGHACMLGVVYVCYCCIPLN